MKVMSNILARFGYEKRSNTSNPLQWFIDWVHGGEETSTGLYINESSALKYTPFWAAVRVITGTIASLPFIVYRRNASGGKNRVMEHPVYELLHNRPNEYMDALTFIETRQAHVLTYGNGYAEIQRDGGGRPIALWPLLPNKTFRQISKEGVAYYEVRQTTGPTVFLPDYNVLHIKGLGFDGYTGYNVVSFHKEAIGYGVAVKEFGGRFFGNNATPGGVLTHPKILSDPARKNLKESWELAHKGLSRSHRMQVLEEGMKWEKIGIDPEQAQALEVQKYTVDDCSRIFNIPPHKIGSLERATFCLPADVEIYTENGNKSIAEVRVGEKVWSLNEDGKWVLSVVTKTGCTGKDEILNIHTTNRNIRANAKHKILVRRKYTAPRKGKGGHQCIKWRSEYVQAGELKIGDVLIASEKLPDLHFRMIIRNRVLTEEFMEFCGLLIGDGNVYDSGITIARDRNASYMNHYRDVIKNCFVSYDGGNGVNGNVGVLTKQVQLQEGDRQTRFSSVLAGKELKELGFSGTARTKRVPGWVFETNCNLRLAFLRGFLDADGSVDKNGRISFSSCNEKMLSQMRHLCISCGIAITNMRCQEGVTTLPNGKPKAYKQYGFTCSNPADNLLISSNDPRYIKRMANGKPFDKKGRKYPWHGGRGFDIDGCSLSRIVSIDKEPPEIVYDLTVEGSHSFIANGIVVHNSNIEELNIDFITQTMLYWFRKWEEECNYKLFMPSEKKSHFCEILVDGLLRGKTLSRYQAYNIGRNAGFLCVDDIREKENMNPLPDGKGQIFLEPMNMKPAGTEPEPKPEPKLIEEDSIHKAHRDLIVSQILRVIRKKFTTFESQRDFAKTILFEPVNAYASTLEGDIEVRGMFDNTIDELIDGNSILKEEDAGKLADRIINVIGDNGI